MTPWEKFLAFEEKFKLFDLKEEELFIWDIIRFPVYLDYMWENFQDQQAKESIGAKVLLSLKRIGYLIPFLFKPSRANLFFTYSRDRTAEGLFYDKTANDFLQRLHRHSHIIESYPVGKKKYLYPVSLIIPPGIFNRICYFLYRGKDHRALLDKINSSLNLDWNNKRINRLISYFRSEKIFYSLLLGLKRPQRIYFTYGVPKALLAAAKGKDVETIEFQHGIIDQGHIAITILPP